MKEWLRERLFSGLKQERVFSIKDIIYGIYLVVFGIFYKEEEL
ncbi:hypothetical protein [uncultured Cetobacterium sp.]|nr:hypothetical protein [uncultured Cetobacterium sp.]